MSEYVIEVWSRGEWFPLPYLYTDLDMAKRIANRTVGEAIEGEGLGAGVGAVRVRSRHVKPVTQWYSPVHDGTEPLL